MSLFRSSSLRRKIFLSFLVLFTILGFEVVYLLIFPIENMSVAAWASPSNTPARKSKNKLGKSHKKIERKQEANSTKKEVKKAQNTAKQEALTSKRASIKKNMAVQGQDKNKAGKESKVINSDKQRPSKRGPSKVTNNAASGKPNYRVKFNWPVHGPVVSGYGSRRTSYGGGESTRSHKGIDIMVPSGTPVMAAAEGTVILSGWQRGYGQIIMIAHEDNFVTLYAHNSKRLVKEGTRVRKGQFIALSGNTGRSTSPHVHFEIRKSDRAINPRPLLPSNKT